MRECTIWSQTENYLLTWLHVREELNLFRFINISTLIKLGYKSNLSVRTKRNPFKV